MHYEQDPNRLEVYLEIRKRRLLVGMLEFDLAKNIFVFSYEKKYLASKSAIPVGPELPMSKLKHTSERNQLFPTFLDRIPSRENPAYKEYCQSQGISVNEQNLIILLTTIGHRGPSFFIYEPIFIEIGDIAQELKTFRKNLGLSQWDVAMVFDIPEITIKKIEARQTTDSNILRLINYYLTFPNIVLLQLSITGKKVHADTRTKVYRYFKAKLSKSNSQK